MGNTYEDIGKVTHSIQAITSSPTGLNKYQQLHMETKKYFPKLLITLDTEKLGISFQIIQQRLARL